MTIIRKIPWTRAPSAEEGISLNRASPQAKDIVLWAPLTQGGGAPLDFSGRGHIGSWDVGPTNRWNTSHHPPGAPGHRVHNSDSGNHFSFPDSDDWHGNQYTFSCWLKPSSTSAERAFLMKGGYSASWSFAFEQNGTALRCFIANPTSDAGSNRNDLTSVFTANVPVHIALRFDGTESTSVNRLRAFVNGVERAMTETGTINSTIGNSTGTLHVGQFNGLGRVYAGEMFNLVINKGLLSDQTIYEMAVTKPFDLWLPRTQLIPVGEVAAGGATNPHYAFGHPLYGPFAGPIG